MRSVNSEDLGKDKELGNVVGRDYSVRDMVRTLASICGVSHVFLFWVTGGKGWLADYRIGVRTD